MAKKELVENIVKLYSKLGGNMNDVLGSRSNVTFLGTGRNPEPFVEMDINMEAVGALGKSKILEELKSPMGYLTANKLNDIQATKLYNNMLKLEDYYYPKQVSNIIDLGPGTGVERTITRNLDQEGLGALRARGAQKPKMTGDENLDYDFVETPEGYVKVPGSEGAFYKFGKKNKEFIDRSAANIADDMVVEQMYRTSGPRSLDEDKMYLAEFIAEDAGKVLDDLPLAEQNKFIKRAENALIRNVKQYQDLPPPGSRGGPDDIAAPIQSAEETIRQLRIQDPDLANQVRKMMDEGIMSTVTNRGDMPGKRASAREFLVEALKKDVTDKGVNFGKTQLNDVISAEDVRYILEGGGGIGGDPIMLVEKYFGPKIVEALPVGATGDDIIRFTKRVLEEVVDAAGNRPGDPKFDRFTAKFIDEMAEGGRAGFRFGKSAGKAFGLAKKIANINKSVDEGTEMGYQALREYGLEAEDITRLFKELAMDKTMVGPEKTAYFKMLNQVLKNPDKFPEGIIEIKKRLGLNYADGGRAGFRYGGDTMGGPNDRSIGGEGPKDYSSDLQTAINNASIEIAQDYNRNNNQGGGGGPKVGITTIETPQSKNINTLTKTGLLNEDEEDQTKNIIDTIFNPDIAENINKVTTQTKNLLNADPDLLATLGLNKADGGRVGFRLGKSVFSGIANMFKKGADDIDLVKQEETFRTGPITEKFLGDVDKRVIDKFIRTRDTSGPGSFGMYDNIAEMPQGLQAAEFIKRVRVPGENRIDYEKAEMFIGGGIKLTGKETIDELIEMYINAMKSYKSPFKAAQGGRAGFMAGGIGKFTKAQVLIERLKNTIKDSKNKTDEISVYVNETFPNFIKEIKANPKLAENENVWKTLGIDLPKDQKLVVYSDDTVDFFRQTEGPQNIAKVEAFMAKHPFLSREDALRIMKMEPEDQVLEITRLEVLNRRTKNAQGGLAKILEV